MQETPSRCGTRGRTCHTVPISTAEHGVHTSPSCREWRGAQPFQHPHCCFLQKTAHFHSPSSPSSRRDGSAPRPAPLPRGERAGQGCSAWSMISLGGRSSLMVNGGPQHAQAGPLGWGLSYWASATQAFSLLRPDLFVPGSILTAETGGAGQPSSASAQQMGLPGPLPAAQPQAVALHPGCSLQPPAERHQSCLLSAHTVPGTACPCPLLKPW